jgi:sulfur-carrier protein adenylyltransferase/sulfurtransferase
MEQYQRQIILPGFGMAAQQKLNDAKVLVVGCGGLGSPVLLYLAAAGVGNIGIIENDTVDISNLHRQILFDTTQIGLSKIKEAAKKLKAINVKLNLELFEERLNAKNALKIFEKYDLIVDGSDNFPTRYLVNDACEILNKPNVYGAIHQYEGQVGVFNYQGSSTYRDLYPEPPSKEMSPNCAEAGVIGSLAGIIGSLQATESIKILTGIGKPLVNRILLVDVLEMNFRNIKFTKKTDRQPIKELIDYELFCNMNQETEFEINKAGYENWLETGHDHILVDVRSYVEHEIFNIGGVNIPVEEVEENEHVVGSEVAILLHCATGQRSRMLAKRLREEKNWNYIYSLNANLNEFK